MTKNKTKTKTKSKNPNMRNATIRITLKNIVHEDNEKLGLKAGDVFEYTLADILDILDDWSKTKKGISYYVILHDDDPENKHVHIVIEFSGSSQCKFNTLKKKFPYGFIDSCRHGVHACVRYLTHCDHSEKHQYNWDDVITNNIAKLERYKQPTKYKEMLYVNKIIEQICNGNIKEYEFPVKIEPALYVKYKTKFSNAVDFYTRRVINNPDRSIKVYVCQGPPRVGKSLFCKVWAKKHNKSICFSSASRDPWQDYHGEDVFVYDDFNYETNKIEDFLKVLDPHNNTSVNARYRNRVFLGDTIFICTNTSIINWFFASDETLREALYKRISYVLDFQDFKRKYNELYYKSLQEYNKRLELEKGVARFTINRIARINDVDQIVQKDYWDKIEFSQGRFLMCIESDEGFADETKYHYFDLKKYIVLSDKDENMDKKFIEDINDI